jgi:hypothetical protein
MLQAQMTADKLSLLHLAYNTRAKPRGFTKRSMTKLMLKTNYNCIYYLSISLEIKYKWTACLSSKEASASKHAESHVQEI